MMRVMIRKKEYSNGKTFTTNPRFHGKDHEANLLCAEINLNYNFRYDE